MSSTTRRLLGWAETLSQSASQPVPLSSGIRDPLFAGSRVRWLACSSDQRTSGPADSGLIGRSNRFAPPPRGAVFEQFWLACAEFHDEFAPAVL